MGRIRYRDVEFSWSRDRALSSEAQSLLQLRLRSIPALAPLADDPLGCMVGSGLATVVGFAVLEFRPERN